MKTLAKIWIFIGILAILSPLGIWLPERFKSGSAWGEWGVGEVSKASGYRPAGMDNIAGFWKAPLPDYSFKGWEDKTLYYSGPAYIISAAAGIFLVAVIMLLFGKFLFFKETPGKKGLDGEGR
jgi:hypothetical protein